MVESKFEPMALSLYAPSQSALLSIPTREHSAEHQTARLLRHRRHFSDILPGVRGEGLEKEEAEGIQRQSPAWGELLTSLQAPRKLRRLDSCHSRGAGVGEKTNALFCQCLPAPFSGSENSVLAPLL